MGAPSVAENIPSYLKLHVERQESDKQPVAVEFPRTEVSVDRQVYDKYDRRQVYDKYDTKCMTNMIVRG